MQDNAHNTGDPATVLIVDDDAAVCWALRQAVEAEGHRVVVAADAAQARRVLEQAVPDVMMTDIRMPGESGLDLLAAVRRSHPSLPIIVMTAHGTMETAVAALQGQAFEYLAKPLDLDRVCELLRRALGEDHLVALADGGGDEVAPLMVGATPAMQEVYRRVAAASATNLGVLITGPTGSGKELVARALHQHSQRHDGPFMAVNCGALSETLVDSELFGHEAGAFTDARSRKIGRIEAADGGTLFLDEVGELPPATQVRLLRFLEDQCLTRLGGETEIQVDVRVVAATNRDLDQAVENGSFRRDLAYRLQVVRICLPPLCERRDDLEALVRHFLRRSGQRLNRDLALTDEAMATLAAYDWPGNVRELKHVIEEAAVLASGGIIAAEDLRISPHQGQGADRDGLAMAVTRMAERLINDDCEHAYDRLHELVDAPLIRLALARTGGNQLRAAELLGINRITLKKRMDHLDIGR